MMLSELRGFMRWWGEQLADWLPARLREALAGRATELRLVVRDGGWQLLLHHRGRDTELGTDAELDAAALRTALAAHPAVQRITLRLPPGHYLSRTVDLPLAAAGDLAQAIGYQIDTLTPFGRDQLWLFCGEQQRLPDGKRLRAWLVAVPRRGAQALADLGLDVDGDPAGPRRAPADGDTITLKFRPAAVGARLPLGWTLAGLNLVVLMLAAGLHLDNREAELALLKERTQALQPQALAASDLAREADTLQQRLDKLQQARETQPPRVAVLDDLTRRLDDQTWVTRMELRNRQLRLQGTSSNASALIGELDDSPLLGEVRFEASLTRDPAGGGERFNLAGKVIGPKTEAQP